MSSRLWQSTTKQTLLLVGLNVEFSSQPKNDCVLWVFPKQLYAIESIVFSKINTILMRKPIQQKITVWISGNFRWWMNGILRNFRKRAQPCEVRQRSFSQNFYRELPLYVTFLPEVPEFLVEWFAFRKVDSSFSMRVLLPILSYENKISFTCKSNPEACSA